MPRVNCKICGQSFYAKPSHVRIGWGKYCSQTCRTEAQLLGKKVECFICKKKIYRSRAQIKHSKSGNFFCSKACQTQWRNSYFSEELHPNWISGINAYRRILLRSGVDRTCAICGITDLRILVTHHIDHNRKNNDLLNLTWLCLNCHYLVHHDKNLEDKLKNTL